jgi:diguanylate cyclase (GGDEF)-like protein/PAS domain S-box-containing protein
MPTTERRRSWHDPWLWCRRLAVPLAGLLLSAAATVVFAAFDRSVRKAQYEMACDNRILAIRRHVETNITLLRALQAFARDNPDRDWSAMHKFVKNFTPLAQDIARYYWWNPSAAPGIVQPLEAYPADATNVIFSGQVVKAAIERADETDLPAVTILPGPGHICIVALAVRRSGRKAAGEGVVLSFGVGQLVEEALAVLRPAGIHLAVLAPDGTELHRHAARPASIARAFATSAGGIFQPAPAEWTRVFPLQLGDATWSLKCLPIDRYLDALDVFNCWGVFAFGLVLTAFADRLLERRRKDLARIREQLWVETQEKNSVKASLQESEDRFRRSYMDASVGMIMAELDGRITSVNRSICRLIGAAKEELIGSSVQDLVLEEDRERARQGTRQFLQDPNAKGAFRDELRFQARNGSILWLRTSVSIIHSDGQPSHWFALLEDISAQMEAQKQLEFQASRDALTGLCNRRAFEAALENAVEDASKSGGQIALMYIDLDGFKLVNDSLGHAVGDLLLPAVAKRIGGCLPSSARLARVGGDEFTIILMEQTDADDLHARANDILHAVQQPYRLAGHELFVSASIGICVYPRHGIDAGTLVQHADAAMYQAKHAGKSHYRFFTPGMAAAAQARLRLENDLRRALERSEIFVEFQPLVRSRDRELVRFEALCRWLHPLQGRVDPEVFIPIAEECGLIASIGRWVLEQACFRAVSLNSLSVSPLRMAVNVSVVQLFKNGFVAEVAEILKATGLPAHLLEIELTESVLVRDPDGAVRRLSELKSLGVRLALDDFGTGYSSLSYLQRLPLDTLKIDRSFVRDVSTEPRPRQLTASLIALAHGVGLEVVGEGVEYEDQARVLEELGCDFLQGYLFSKPVNGGDAAGLVRRLSPAPVHSVISLPMHRLAAAATGGAD